MHKKNTISNILAVILFSWLSFGIGGLFLLLKNNNFKTEGITLRNVPDLTLLISFGPILFFKEIKHAPIDSTIPDYDESGNLIVEEEK